MLGEARSKFAHYCWTQGGTPMVIPARSKPKLEKLEQDLYNPGRQPDVHDLGNWLITLTFFTLNKVT